MRITIDIPNCFFNKNNAYVGIEGDGCSYCSPCISNHGLAAEEVIEYDLLMEHLDKITDEVRKAIKDGSFSLKYVE